MRLTRFEMMNELRRMVGPTEETEILIDWLQDAWQTYDALIECVGKKHAYQAINAVDLFHNVVTQHDLTSYNSTDEQTNRYFLN